MVAADETDEPDEADEVEEVEEAAPVVATPPLFEVTVEPTTACVGAVGAFVASPVGAAPAELHPNTCWMVNGT